MTLNYWMMLERDPNLKEEVGGSIHSSVISSLLDRKLVTQSTASCALALAYQPFVSKNNDNNNQCEVVLIIVFQYYNYQMV